MSQPVAVGSIGGAGGFQPAHHLQSGFPAGFGFTSEPVGDLLLRDFEVVREFGDPPPPGGAVVAEVLK